MEKNERHNPACLQNAQIQMNISIVNYINSKYIFNTNQINVGPNDNMLLAVN